VGETLNHEWFKSFAVPHPTVVSDSILQAMQEFQGYNHLKKAALTAVAYHLNNVGVET
jgi:singapore isolate B (sub-type 7) whole genome shotgun sequence assembly, scaffold_23